jgi:small subunit ribosomal protein S16
VLAIRLQRTGRSGHAQFRVIVQDSRFSPTRGRVVSYLGSYNPHTKVATLDSEKAGQYMAKGAQPSDTVARLFKKEGIKLPDWVQLDQPQKRTVRNPEKRRSTAPAPEASNETEVPVENTDTPAKEPTAEAAPEKTASEPTAEDAPAKEPASEPQASEEKPADPTPQS